MIDVHHREAMTLNLSKYFMKYFNVLEFNGLKRAFTIQISSCIFIRYSLSKVLLTVLLWSQLLRVCIPYVKVSGGGETKPDGKRMEQKNGGNNPRALLL